MKLRKGDRVTYTGPYLLLGILAGESRARLVERCKEMGITGYSKMSRTQLQIAIIEATAEE